MTDTVPNVVVIPANPELARRSASKRQLRVAAYCRVSTNDEEQLTSYEAQKTYYTVKIMTNPDWTMAGIFADARVIISPKREALENTGVSPFWSYRDIGHKTGGDTGTNYQ